VAINGGVFMNSTVKNLYTDEELTRMEICNFINEGAKDIKDGNLLEFDEVFNELEERYADI